MTWEKGHKALYHHSLDTNWESRKVAVVNEGGVCLEETEWGNDIFMNDLNGGLLDEIGRFFIRRARESRRKADVMGQAVENPAISFARPRRGSGHCLTLLLYASGQSMVTLKMTLP